jgi:hypothetical protein
MDTAVFFKTTIKLSRTTAIVAGILFCQFAAAKSVPRNLQTSTTDPSTMNVIINHNPGINTANHPLNLNLPDTGIKPAETNNWSEHATAIDSSNNPLQLMAGNKKQTPVKMDCGMDVLPTSNPDVALTSRLTGECDFKYHY